MPRLEYEIPEEMQDTSYHGVLCESPTGEVIKCYGSSAISLPLPAAAAGASTLPSRLRLEPSPDIRSSQPSSPPLAISQNGLTSSQSALARATSGIPLNQSEPGSASQKIAHQRTSSSSLMATASTTSLEGTHKRHKARKSSAIAEFFTGSSEVISAFGGSSKRVEKSTPGSSQPTHSRRPSLTRSNGSSLSSAASSLFGRGRASPTKAGSLTAPRRIAEEDAADFGFEHDDDFLNLRIEKELFPDARGDFDGVSGTPEEAFDALLANSERLFMRMQIAYQEKHEALLLLKARRKEDAEELEEAKERNGHLKAQLDTLGCALREKEDDLQQAVTKLGVEKELRQADAERRVRSVRIVRANDGSGFRSQPVASEASSVRSSQENSSENGEIWSRPNSPSAASISTMPDELDLSSYSPGQDGGGLREENMRLKARIAELEDTVEGCLGLVHDL